MSLVDTRRWSADCLSCTSLLLISIAKLEVSENNTWLSDSSVIWEVFADTATDVSVELEQILEDKAGTSERETIGLNGFSCVISSQDPLESRLETKKDSLVDIGNGSLVNLTTAVSFCSGGNSGNTDAGPCPSVIFKLEQVSVPETEAVCLGVCRLSDVSQFF